MRQSVTDVIFLWHMHQPCYRVPSSDVYMLPWVRLHGIKDYYGMAKMIDKFDSVKVTFNFSGILLDQLIDYTKNKAQDIYGLLTLKKPQDLTKKERDFIVERFFSLNFERFIRPHKRYMQLHHKKVAGKEFSAHDLCDLQAIFNLCWFHPYSIKADKNIRDLLRKGKNYTQKDKEYIIAKQYDILKQIVPLYRKLIKHKRIELSLTPYSHPIMPLVYDTDILKEFSYLKKPHARFTYPNDCRWHLAKARDIFLKVFDHEIVGSWPSEGSVSESVAETYANEKFSWIGTDEGILFKSLMTEFVSYDLIKNQRHLIYRPYNFRGINIFFRDRNLSDALSFIYQGWEDPVFAAHDILEHFKRTHYYTRNLLEKRAITIIMDGENAWEYYKNNGVEFLETIYGALERSQILSSTTPSEYLKKQTAKTKKLQRLAPGSWINNDFGVWVGSRENNRNWDIIAKIRTLIERSAKTEQQKQKALALFYIIEGSDWNWWNTFEDFTGDFSKIFRSYSKAIYKILAKKPPSYIM